MQKKRQDGITVFANINSAILIIKLSCNYKDTINLNRDYANKYGPVMSIYIYKYYALKNILPSCEIFS